MTKYFDLEYKKNTRQTKVNSYDLVIKSNNGGIVFFLYINKLRLKNESKRERESEGETKTEKRIMYEDILE